ncbi:MAG: hypothetical protein IJK97_03250, partial [Thermoguttaceae bacterium]|nr:hypothetical protein [Thermoguttaceae bacterium]
ILTIGNKKRLAQKSWLKYIKDYYTPKFKICSSGEKKIQKKEKFWGKKKKAPRFSFISRGVAETRRFLLKPSLKLRASAAPCEI